MAASGRKPEPRWRGARIASVPPPNADGSVGSGRQFGNRVPMCAHVSHGGGRARIFLLAQRAKQKKIVVTAGVGQFFARTDRRRWACGPKGSLTELRVPRTSLRVDQNPRHNQPAGLVCAAPSEISPQRCPAQSLTGISLCRSIPPVYMAGTSSVLPSDREREREWNDPTRRRPQFRRRFPRRRRS